MTDVMLDIEALGTTPTGAVVAIGAVRFDPYGWNSQHSVSVQYPIAMDDVRAFYTVISLKDATKYGTVDGDTLHWWFNQSEEARKEIATAKGRTLKDGLGRFWKWLELESYDRIWAFPPTFDISLLDNSYRLFYDRQPWPRVKIRDMRTALDILTGNIWPPHVPEHNKHHALWDAWRQAYIMEWAFAENAKSRG